MNQFKEEEIPVYEPGDSPVDIMNESITSSREECESARMDRLDEHE